MTTSTGRGRTGLLAVVALVVLVHGLALDRLAGSLSGNDDTAPPPPVPSQVRLITLTPPPAAVQPRPAPTAKRPANPTPSTAPRPFAPPQPALPPVASATPPEPAAELPSTSAETAPSDAPADASQASSSRLQLQVEAPAADTPPPVALPPDADLQYQVQGQARGLRYTASGELRWRHSGDRYELSMRLSAFLVGSRSQSSVGQLDATGLLPERFSDRTRSERAAHFDRAAGRIRFSNNAPDAPLRPGAQDRLSVFIQLAGLLQAGPYPAGSTVALPVTGVGGSEDWRFAVGDLETLSLPAGNLAARKLVREPADTYDSRVEVWLAPDLGHLPVRLRITQAQGDVADQQLSQRP